MRLANHLQFVALAICALSPLVRDAGAAPGDPVATVTFSTDCAGSQGLGVGIAFDGTNLWYSCYATPTDLHKADPVTGQVLASFNVAGGLGALAWDSKRKKLWAGAGCAAGQDGSEIYLIDPKSGKATLEFKVPNGAGQCLDDGLAYDGTSDSIFFSPDGATNIRHLDSTGTPLPDDNAPWNGSGCYNSGLAIGGGLLYEGSDGCNHVWVVEKDSKEPKYDFSTGDNRDEDLECDTVTFAGSGKHVMWSKEAYAPARAHAFEIPFGSCGVGGRPAPPPVVPTDIMAFSDGELLRTTSGHTYIVYGGSPFLIREKDFIDMQFDPALVEVMPVRRFTRLLPREPEVGTALQEFHSASVYVMDDICRDGPLAGLPCLPLVGCPGGRCRRVKRYVPDLKTFTAMGYAKDDIAVVPDGSLRRFHFGPIVPRVPEAAPWPAPAVSHYCVDEAYKTTDALTYVKANDNLCAFDAVCSNVFDPSETCLKLFDSASPCRSVRGTIHELSNSNLCSGDDGDFDFKIRPSCPFTFLGSDCFPNWFFGLGPGTGYSGGSNCDPSPGSVASCELQVEVIYANQVGSDAECRCDQGCSCDQGQRSCGCQGINGGDCAPGEPAFGNRWAISLRAAGGQFASQPVQIIGAMITDDKHKGCCDATAWPEIHPAWRVRFLHDLTRFNATEPFAATASLPTHDCAVMCCSGNVPAGFNATSREDCLAYALDACATDPCFGVDSVTYDADDNGVDDGDAIEDWHGYGHRCHNLGFNPLRLCFDDTSCSP